MYKGNHWVTALIILLFSNNIVLQANKASSELDYSSLSAQERAEWLVGPDGQLLQRQLIQESLVLINNASSILPLDVTDHFAVVRSSEQSYPTFERYFRRYAAYDSFVWKGESTKGLLKEQGEKYKAIVVLVDNVKSPNLLDQQQWWHSIVNAKLEIPLVFVHFGDAYHLSAIDYRHTVLQAFHHNPIAEELMAQSLFGGLELTGKLPYAVNGLFAEGVGVNLNVSRIGYALPEQVGIDSDKLAGIEELMKLAMRKKATPGGQVVVAKSGKIIYSKAFGHHSYNKDREVRPTDVYDLASVTKAAATTFALMKLYDEQNLSVEGRVGHYWPIEGSSRLKGISIRRLLAHQSGLQSNLPIASFMRPFDAVDDKGVPYFKSGYTAEYPIRIQADVFMRKDQYEAYLAKWHRLSISRYRKYRYSDVNFAVLHQVVEHIAQQDMGEFLRDVFYKPMGLRTLGYQPFKRMSMERIVPTSNDRRWRGNLIKGDVHDEGAALQGGVAGHAGLFGNAEDLAILFQLITQEGAYGDEELIKPTTVDMFISSNRLNHRALGFDRMKLNHDDGRTTLIGHSGFSGTCVWADPETDLVFVFLSNRIHPNPKNDLLIDLGIRRKMLKVVMDAINTYKA